MPPDQTGIPHRGAVLLIAATAIGATVAGLGNGFAYDDVPIVAENLLLHDLRNLPVLLGRAYWPNDGAGLLWRPVATAGFAVQWAIGGGSAVIFHLGNLLLTIACSLALYAVARRVLPANRATLAGLLFAALPVHTEVTANVVGQAELWCAFFVLLAVRWFLQDASAPTRERSALVALSCVFAAMSKEQGFTAPAILFACECMRPNGPRPWRTVARHIAPTVASLAALVLLRTLLLEGFGGGPVIPALRGLHLVERATVMLGIVPRMIETLVWPVRLVADYNPGDVPIEATLGATAGRGALLLLVALGLACTAARRGAALGALAGAAAAFAPAANVLVPTGVVFAERHLFLPSAMLVLLPCLIISDVRRGALRSGLIVAVGAVLLLSTWKSIKRTRDWQSTETLVASIVRDAPRNYRGLMLSAAEQVSAGRPDSAEVLLRRSLALFDKDARAWDDLGQLVRRREGCAAAQTYFLRAVELQPDREIARSRLRACLRDRREPAKE